MNPIDAMQAFVRVAELGSFTRSAEALDLPKATVSSLVRQLETELGAQLLHRTTRSVRLTQDGQLCYDRCKDLLADLDDLRALFQRSAPTLRGRLRVDLPVGIARHHVIPNLPQFLAAHPLLTLELSSTDRRVDLVGEGFDCVLRVGPVIDTSLIAKPLGRLRVVNCASPAYIARYGRPNTLEDLDTHRLVHYAASFGARPDGFEYHDGEGYRTREMHGALTVNNSQAYEAACLAGLGLIQAPAIGLRAQIAEGRLVEVLPQYRAEPMPVWLLYAHRRHPSTRLRAFVEWLEAVLKPQLDPES